MLSICFGLQLFNGFGSAGSVAYWANVGGFVSGVVLALPYWLSQGGQGFWRRTDGHPPHPETQVPTRLSPVPIVRRRR